MRYHALTCDPDCPGDDCLCDCHCHTPEHPALGRFMEKVNQAGEGGCWLWLGAKSSTGYGTFNIGSGRFKGAHRYSYEAHVGPVPAGLVLDHLCRTPLCVNPGHLEPVTQRENSRRGLGGANNATKTHCPKDHPYTPENTYTYTRKRTGRTVRMCKTCHSDETRRRVARNLRKDE